MAEDLLVAESFRDMTMDSIAESIGVAKSTLYHYFPKKDDILAALMKETLEALIAPCERRRASPMSPAQQIYECMSEVIELTAASPGRARALYEQKRALGEAQRVEISALERRYFRLLVDMVKAATQAGEIGDVDPTIATHAITALVAHTRHWYSNDGRYAPRELAYMFWHMLINGASGTSAGGAVTPAAR